MAAGAGPARRRLGGEPPSWVRALQTPPQVAELVGEVTPAGGAAAQMRLLDALEAELAPLPGVERWALRLPGRRRRLAETAVLADGAGLNAEAVMGALVVVASRLTDLRPLMEGMGADDAPLLAVGLADANADRVLGALRSGDEAGAVRGSRVAVIHRGGSGWAVLLHDPATSGLTRAPAGTETAAPELREGRPKPRRVTAGAALAIGAAAALAILVLALRGAGSGTSSPGPQTPPPLTPVGAATPVPLGVVVPVLPGPAPSVRQQPGSAVDPGTGVTLLFGGIAPSGRAGVDVADTWTWSRGSWTQLHPADAPSPRHGAVVAPDLFVAGSFLLVGGTHAGAYLDDTWQWNGSDWRLLSGLPPVGQAVAMAADPRTQEVVLVTRTPDGQEHTYVRASGVWLETSTPTPQLRLLAGDAQLGIVGLEAQPNPLVGPARTWRWTGSGWAAAEPATEPGFDVLTATLTGAPGGGQLLVQADFLVPTEIHGGTWTYGGSTWRRVPGPVPDFVRAFDAVTPVWGLSGGDPVLIGGSTTGGDAYQRAARWDGRAWTAL